MTASASAPAFSLATMSAPVLGRILAAARGVRNALIAIDGASGAGKSTLADSVVAAWRAGPIGLIRLDDVYPGWDGLDRAAVLLSRGLVAPRRRGRLGRVPEWDWARDAPGVLASVRPAGTLVLEGCGAFEAVGGHADVRVWVEASEPVRRAAGLRRDRGAYDPHWDRWDRQWRRHDARTHASRTPAIRVAGVREAPN